MQKVKKGYDKNYKTVKNGIVCLKKKHEKKTQKEYKNAYFTFKPTNFPAQRLT